MMAMILGILKKNPITSLLGAGLVVTLLFLGGTVIYKNLEISNLENRLGKLENKVEKLNVEIDRQLLNVSSCRAKVDEMNQDLDQLSKESEVKQNKIDSLNRQIASEQLKIDTNVENIRKRETPKTCESAINFIRNELYGG